MYQGLFSCIKVSFCVYMSLFISIFRNSTVIPAVCVAWLFALCVTWLILMRDMAHSHVSHNSCIYVSHDSLSRVSWLFYVSRDWFMCMTWLLEYIYIHMQSYHTHMYHMSHVYDCRIRGMSLCSMCEMIDIYVYDMTSYDTCVYDMTQWLTATHCNSLQLTATHCNSLQLTAMTHVHISGITGMWHDWFIRHVTRVSQVYDMTQVSNMTYSYVWWKVSRRNLYVSHDLFHIE